MATVNHTTNLFSFSSLNIIWRPRIDGDVIVRDPLVSVAKGLYAKIPIMTGDADDEGTLFSLSNTNITCVLSSLPYVSIRFAEPTTSLWDICNQSTVTNADLLNQSCMAVLSFGLFISNQFRTLSEPSGQAYSLYSFARRYPPSFLPSFH